MVGCCFVPTKANQGTAGSNLCATGDDPSKGQTGYSSEYREDVWALVRPVNVFVKSRRQWMLISPSKMYVGLAFVLPARSWMAARKRVIEGFCLPLKQAQDLLCLASFFAQHLLYALDTMWKSSGWTLPMNHTSELCSMVDGLE